MKDENLDQKERLLEQATRKAANRSLFLASALETFKEMEKLDEAELATLLNIEAGQLRRLALCRRPDPSNSQAFRQDIAAISQHFGLAPARLANLLRRVAAYEANESVVNSGYLMAARDYEAEPEENDD